MIPTSPVSSEGYVTVNGVAHFYRSIGNGEPVVVLHGGPGMWHDELFPFFGDLALDHRVVFYDQRGNGRSLMPEITMENFTVDWLVSDLEELRRAWEFDRMNVVGHSWGGLLGMYYASRHPERVERLVLVDAAPVNSDLLMQSYRASIDRLGAAEWEHLEEMYGSSAYLEGDPACLNAAMRLSEGVTFHECDPIGRAARCRLTLHQGGRPASTPRVRCCSRVASWPCRSDGSQKSQRSRRAPHAMCHRE